MRPRHDAFAGWTHLCRRSLASDAGSADVAADRLALLVRSVPAGLTAAQWDVARALLQAAWLRTLSVLAPHSERPALRLVTPGSHRDDRVATAVAVIAHRFADPTLRLRDVARQLAVSDCHLTHLLKQATGWTFGRHLHARRIAEARTLLAGSTLSVKEIAARAGYSTTTQLDRHFKKALHVMPSAYRATVRAPATQLPTERQIGRCIRGPAP